jgi:hypothetical protein
MNDSIFRAALKTEPTVFSNPNVFNRNLFFRKVRYYKMLGFSNRRKLNKWFDFPSRSEYRADCFFKSLVVKTNLFYREVRYFKMLEISSKRKLNKWFDFPSHSENRADCFFKSKCIQ